MAQITKDTKNIIEAGITPEEYSRIEDDRIPLSDYMEAWPTQEERWYHVGELAELRGDKELAKYFKDKGEYPREYSFDNDI